MKSVESNAKTPRHRTAPAFLLAFLVAAGLLVAACGNGGSQTSSSAKPAETKQEASGGAEKQQGASGGQQGAKTGGDASKPDFTMTPDKSAVSFADASQPVQVTIKLAAQGGFDLTKLAVKAEGVPNDVSAEVGKVTASGSEGSVVVTFRLKRTDAARGDYPVKIVAEGAGVKHEQTVTVKVTKTDCG